MREGCIRERGKGSWQIIWEAPRAPGTKRQPRSMTVRGSKKEAEAKLREILTAIDNKTYVDPSKLTVGEYLEKWLEHTESTVSATTWTGYASYTRTHLKPKLGHLPLTRLSPLSIQEFYTAMLREGRADGKGEISPRTVKHAHVILRGALARAVKLRLLTINPCDAVEPPRVEDEELHSFTEDQVVTLLTAVRETVLHIPVILAVATGCRRGELCGLRWSDIDLDRGQIQVRRATEVTKAGVGYKQPKTKRSRRAVPLPAFALMALRLHKGQQAQQQLLLGSAYHEGGHVLTWEDGRPLHPDYITKAFAKLARKLDLPTTRFHALRHTCASVLLKEDVHPRIVSEILGHDDVRTTLNRYSHLLPGLAGDAMRKMDDAIRRAGGG